MEGLEELTPKWALPYWKEGGMEGGSPWSAENVPTSLTLAIMVPLVVIEWNRRKNEAEFQPEAESPLRGPYEPNTSVDYWLTTFSNRCIWLGQKGWRLSGRKACLCHVLQVGPWSLIFLSENSQHWIFLLLSCWPATGLKLVQFNYNKHMANELYLTLASTPGLSSDRIILAYATLSP